jgi:hypothetical protein
MPVFTLTLTPVLGGGGVDGYLLFPIPSMNRVGQTEPLTFSLLSFCALFRDNGFLYFISYSIQNL